MLNLKSKIESSRAHFKLDEGLYTFAMPFVGYNSTLGTCTVELSLGAGEGRNKGTSFLITAVVISSLDAVPPLEHFIEDVAANIKNFISFYCDNEELINAPEDSIRWFECLPYYMQGRFREVKMTWNEKHRVYSNAIGATEWIEPADWETLATSFVAYGTNLVKFHSDNSRKADDQFLRSES